MCSSGCAIDTSAEWAASERQSPQPNEPSIQVTLDSKQRLAPHPCALRNGGCLLARVEGTVDVALDVLAIPGNVQPGEARTRTATLADLKPGRVGRLSVTQPGQ